MASQPSRWPGLSTLIACWRAIREPGGANHCKPYTFPGAYGRPPAKLSPHSSQDAAGSLRGPE